MKSSGELPWLLVATKNWSQNWKLWCNCENEIKASQFHDHLSNSFIGITIFCKVYQIHETFNWRQLVSWPLSYGGGLATPNQLKEYTAASFLLKSHIDRNFHCILQCKQVQVGSKSHLSKSYPLRLHKNYHCY